MNLPLFTDIHCHLLPGIDDGSPDWDTTLALARLAVAENIGTMVTTPHQLGRYQKNSPALIRTLAAEAQTRLDDAGIPLKVFPGGDIRIHENLPKLVVQDEVVTLADRRAHLLLELPHEQALPLGSLLYALECEGVRGILSHPERNVALMREPELCRPWVQQGCLLQITAGSVTGDFGKTAQNVCRYLLKEELVHFVATDAHDLKHRPPQMRKAFDTVCKWASPAAAVRLFATNPAAVAQGKEVSAPLPLTAPRRAGLGSWFSSALATLKG